MLLLHTHTIVTHSIRRDAHTIVYMPQQGTGLIPRPLQGFQCYCFLNEHEKPGVVWGTRLASCNIIPGSLSPGACGIPLWDTLVLLSLLVTAPADRARAPRVSGTLG